MSMYETYSTVILSHLRMYVCTTAKMCPSSRRIGESFSTEKTETHPEMRSPSAFSPVSSYYNSKSEFYETHCPGNGLTRQLAMWDSIASICWEALERARRYVRDGPDTSLYMMSSLSIARWQEPCQLKRLTCSSCSTSN